MRAFFFEPLSSREVLTATPVAQLAIPPAGIGGGIDHLVQISQPKPANFEIQLAMSRDYGVSQPKTGGMEIQWYMQDHQNAAANETQRDLIGTQRNIRNSTSRLD